jgi:hypothetical protein
LPQNRSHPRLRGDMLLRIMLREPSRDGQCLFAAQRGERNAARLRRDAARIGDALPMADEADGEGHMRVHREGGMATGWVRKSIQATEITLAMFNHIRAVIGSAAGHFARR